MAHPTIPLTPETKLKLAKYLCRSYDLRWGYSRRWRNIPEEARNEWLEGAEELITKMNEPGEDWRSDFWPIEK